MSASFHHFHSMMMMMTVVCGVACALFMLRLFVGGGTRKTGWLFGQSFWLKDWISLCVGRGQDCVVALRSQCEEQHYHKRRHTLLLLAVL
jgi:hypothetical protein